ncbi:MAG: aminopeptidase [Clostridia bacterium]
MNKTMLKKYAKLIVKMGANVQKGQGCIISVAVDQEEFALLVQDEAYKAGAKWVRIDWQSQQSLKLKLRHESATQLSKVPEWEETQAQYMVDTLPCRIHIVSDDPDGLKSANPAKFQKYMIAKIGTLKKYRTAIDEKHQWTIAAVPSPKWAKKVFPNDRTSVAMEKMWEAILATVRVSKDNDPVADWQAHNATLQGNSAKLNELELDYLHYTNAAGTDFKAWLMPESTWGGGGDTTKNTNVFFNPNMPTEEVFTSPMAGKAEGTVVATLPLSYQGTLINNFSITFEGGKAVSWTAEQGEETLTNMLTMDDGAKMLGELALIPFNSPISNSGILYYNTLFDENASCHLALGRGFAGCLKGSQDMTEDEMKEKGLNDSLIHVDFMIGSADMNIVGYKKDGTAVQIFENGNWAI